MATGENHSRAEGDRKHKRNKGNNCCIKRTRNRSKERFNRKTTTLPEPKGGRKMVRRGQELRV